MINSALSYINHPISLAKDTYASAPKNKQMLVKGVAVVAGLTAVAAGLYFFGPDIANYCSTSRPGKPVIPPTKPASSSVPTPTKLNPPRVIPSPSPKSTPQPALHKPLLNQSVGSPEKLIEVLSSEEMPAPALPQDNQVSSQTESWFKFPSFNFEPEQYLAEREAAELENMKLFSSNIRSLGEFISSSSTKLKNVVESEVNDYFERRSLVNPRQTLENQRYYRAPLVAAVKTYNAITPVIKEKTLPGVKQDSEALQAAIKNLKQYKIDFINNYRECPASPHHNETAPSYEMLVQDGFQKVVKSAQNVGAGWGKFAIEKADQAHTKLTNFLANQLDGILPYEAFL